MASFRAFFLAGAALLSMAVSARAADLLPEPPPVEPPVYVPGPAVGGGWYLRGDVGAGTLRLDNEVSTFTNPGGVTGYQFVQSSASEEALVDIGVGYQINSYFRADVTGEYRFGSNYQSVAGAEYCYDDVTHGVGACGDSYKGSISSGVFLINGYIDLGTWYRVTPYVGAGVGVAVNNFSSVTDTNIFNTGHGSSSPNTHTGLAYALMAGFSYDLTPNIKLDLGYRYIDMGQVATGAIQCAGDPNCAYEAQHFHMASNDIRLGLRYAFSDPVVYEQPQFPLIRKY